MSQLGYKGAGAWKSVATLMRNRADQCGGDKTAAGIKRRKMAAERARTPEAMAKAAERAQRAKEERLEARALRETMKEYKPKYEAARGNAVQTAWLDGQFPADLAERTAEYLNVDFDDLVKETKAVEEKDPQDDEMGEETSEAGENSQAEKEGEDDDEEGEKDDEDDEDDEEENEDDEEKNEDDDDDEDGPQEPVSPMPAGEALAKELPAHEQEPHFVYVLTEAGEKKLGERPVQRYYPGCKGTTEAAWVRAVAMLGNTPEQVLEEHMLGDTVWVFNKKDAEYELSGGTGKKKKDPLVALQKKVDEAEATAAAVKATQLRKKADEWEIRLPVHTWLAPYCGRH